SLNSIRVDKAFIGTNAIDISAGLTTPNMLEASIKQKMISVANKVYILADNSKFERVSFAKFGKLSDIDACITGDNLPESIKRDFQSKNIKLYLVK
ncbi:MAG TPA: DeoR family transcriptional regulator, partial [Ruminococcaceae bacterium]|nr:DeoR family transcriptional regulator [Oscillospiraceae bacterium]